MTRFRRDEDGMAMITIILSLTIMMALAVAAIQYGLGSQNVSKRDQDWQSALSAAEAGLDNYQFHVNENANYIAYSASNPPPDGNLAFSQYVAVPGGNTSGTYRYTADVSKVGVDGTITVTSTGKVGKMKRTVQSIVRRRSFLDYLYFTDYETQDPAAYTGNPYTATQAQTPCAHHYYDGPQQQLQRHPVHLGRHAQRAGALERRDPHVRVTGLQEHRVDELEHQRHPLAVGLRRHEPGLRQPR